VSGLPEKYVVNLAEAMTRQYPKVEPVAEGTVKILLACSTKRTLQMAANIITGGPLTESALDDAAAALARNGKFPVTELRKVLAKVLATLARSEAKERDGNYTVSACIRVADAALLKRVEAAPAWLFYEEVQDIAVKGMKLKMRPPKAPLKEITAWCELLARDQGHGFATPVLAAELKRACGSKRRSHAAAELKRLVPEPGEEINALIAEFSGKPKPQ
jgi:hypothetical protein